jgi:hypothetical protein
MPAVCLPLMWKTKVHRHTKQSVGGTTSVAYSNLHYQPTTDFVYQWPIASDSHFMLKHLCHTDVTNRCTAYWPTVWPNNTENHGRTRMLPRWDSTGLRYGRDNDIKFYKNSLAGAYEHYLKQKITQFITDIHFFLNSLNHVKRFTGTDWQLFPELTVDSHTVGRWKETLSVVPIDFVWSSTHKTRFHLPHRMLSVPPASNCITVPCCER